MEGYISIREIADNVMDHPMLQDLNFERIIHYAIRFMRKVGIPNTFIEKVEDIKVQSYRAELPCDFYKMNQVRSKDGTMYRYTTDSFHMEYPQHPDKCNHENHYGVDLTYKIQGNVMFTSVKEDVVTISYRALPIDSDGFPLVPDNSAYQDALEAFIKERYFTILFDQGKIIPQILEQAKQEYCWAVGQAQSNMIMPTTDEMESITCMLNTLVPRVTEHKRGFVNLGSREYIRRH